MFHIFYSYSIIQSCWLDDPQQRPSFERLMKKWEDLMLTRTQYLDVTPPPNGEEETISQTETVIVQNDENETSQSLWQPPTFITSTMKGIDNKKYFVDGSADQCWQMGYDMPRAFANVENKEEAVKLRYANIKSPRKRLSHPELSNVVTSYDTPMSNKRVQSYLDMDKMDPTVQNTLNAELQDKLNDVRQISFTFVNN